jgi:hypothetical protein
MYYLTRKWIDKLESIMWKTWLPSFDDYGYQVCLDHAKEFSKKEVIAIQKNDSDVAYKKSDILKLVGTNNCIHRNDLKKIKGIRFV